MNADTPVDEIPFFDELKEGIRKIRLYDTACYTLGHFQTQVTSEIAIKRFGAELAGRLETFLKELGMSYRTTARLPADVLFGGKAKS